VVLPRSGALPTSRFPCSFRPLRGTGFTCATQGWSSTQETLNQRSQTPTTNRMPPWTSFGWIRVHSRFQIRELRKESHTGKLTHPARQANERSGRQSSRPRRPAQFVHSPRLGTSPHLNHSTQFLTKSPLLERRYKQPLTPSCFGGSSGREHRNCSRSLSPTRTESAPNVKRLSPIVPHPLPFCSLQSPIIINHCPTNHRAARPTIEDNRSTIVPRPFCNLQSPITNNHCPAIDDNRSTLRPTPSLPADSHQPLARQPAQN
jgi:hypothetical protein